MRNVLLKEMKLSASVLSYLFIAFGAMFLLPGYPVLCGAIFSSLGIFQTFQTAREANDTVFSVLLPIAKRDVVKGRYMFTCFIEACTLALMAVCTGLRMTLLAGSAVYRSNPLMNANLFALGAAFFLFGLFNWVFAGGFFRTGYQLGKPFVSFLVAGFLCIGAFEALHHVPGLEKLNAFGTDCIGLQLGCLAAGVIAFLLMTLLSCRDACTHFETIDL